MRYGKVYFCLYIVLYSSLGTGDSKYYTHSSGLRGCLLIVLVKMLTTNVMVAPCPKPVTELNRA